MIYFLQVLAIYKAFESLSLNKKKVICNFSLKVCNFLCFFLSKCYSLKLYYWVDDLYFVCS